MAGIFDLKPRRSISIPLPILLLGACFVLPFKIAAAEPETSSTELRGLMTWIGQQDIGLQGIDKIPALARVSRAELLMMAFGNKLPRAVDKNEVNVYGLYNFENETIYLLDSIGLDSERGRSILVHEVVHYLQYQTGADDHARCKNALEPLAYKLEARYLAEHDIRPDFTFGDVRRSSRCA